MIRNISKFIILFFLILIFLGFKNQVKVSNIEVQDLKNIYISELQLYKKRSIQLTKMINQFQIDDIENKFTGENIIKFDRGLLNKFTVIKVNYDKSE